MELFVKASQIYHLNDARYFAAIPHTAWLTFYINKISDIQECKEMASWIAGPKCCAHIRNMPLENIMQAYNDIGLDAIEISTAVYREYKDELYMPVILRIQYTDSLSYKYYQGLNEEIKFIVLVAESIDYFNKSHVQSLCKQFPTVICSDFDILGAADFLTDVKPIGIEIHGSDEDSLGIKNYDVVQRIIDTLWIE